MFTVAGEFKPFSLTGSLPIVADLKDQGFDVQVTGFGRMEVRAIRPADVPAPGSRSHFCAAVSSCRVCVCRARRRTTQWTSLPC